MRSERPAPPGEQPAKANPSAGDRARYIDRSLIRENLKLSCADRLRRQTALARDLTQLRNAVRRRGTR